MVAGQTAEAERRHEIASAYYLPPHLLIPPSTKSANGDKGLAQFMTKASHSSSGLLSLRTLTFTPVVGLRLRRGSPCSLCSEFNVSLLSLSLSLSLLQPLIRDKLTALEAELRYSMIETRARRLAPVIDVTGSTTERDSVSIRKDCGPGKRTQLFFNIPSVEDSLFLTLAFIG